MESKIRNTFNELYTKFDKARKTGNATTEAIYFGYARGYLLALKHTRSLLAEDIDEMNKLFT